MDKLLKQLQSYSFSDKDMMNLIEGKANLVTYPEIAKYKTLDKLLGKHRACIILYLSKPNYGHWTCIFERTDEPGHIIFYDPYGFLPDEELKFNSYQVNRQLGQDKPYLLMLMVKAENKYIYTSNGYRIQKMKKNNNICGRAVGLRLNFRNFGDEEFHNILTKNKYYKPDDWITILTSFIN
jgi:hypothetical protein